MQAGQYYFFELFQVNWDGSGHFTVSVEVPNPDVNAAPGINSVTDVQFINVSYTFQPETISLKVFDFTLPFAIKMQYRNPTTKNVDWLRVSDMQTWQTWSAGRMRDYIDWATGYFTTTCEKFDLDASGNRITSGTAAGREWVCKFY